MNVRSHLPPWAQGPTQSFIKKNPIKGTKTSSLIEETFVDSFKRAEGAHLMAAVDEVKREDSALGQPGIVSRNGLKVFFEGDVSKSKGEFEAVLKAKRRGIEYVTYVHSHNSQYSVLRMINDEGDVELSGVHAHQTRQGQEGVSVTGNFYL